MTIGRGNAGFEYVHPADSSVRHHRLHFPPEIGPGPEVEYGLKKRRREQVAWDRSSRTVFASSADAVETARFLFRFVTYPSDLLMVFSIAADGATLDYYPDLDLTTSYALELEAQSRPIQVSADSDRWYRYEWQMRAAFWSTDRLEPLYLGTNS